MALLSLCFGLLVTSCSTTVEEEGYLGIQANTSELELEVFNLVNEHRSSLGLNTLKFNSIAYTYATTHTKSMINDGTISHKDFDIRSSNLAVETNANDVSENVGSNFKSAEGIVQAWINSETHKTNMEGDYEATAVSAKADKNGVIYFTQLFLR